MENLIQKLYEWGALYGTKVIGAIAILVLGRLLVTVVVRVVNGLLETTGGPPHAVGTVS